MNKHLFSNISHMPTNYATDWAGHAEHSVLQWIHMQTQHPQMHKALTHHVCLLINWIIVYFRRILQFPPFFLSLMWLDATKEGWSWSFQLVYKFSVQTYLNWNEHLLYILLHTHLDNHIDLSLLMMHFTLSALILSAFYFLLQEGQQL